MYGLVIMDVGLWCGFVGVFDMVLVLRFCEKNIFSAYRHELPSERL